MTDAQTSGLQPAGMPTFDGRCRSCGVRLHDPRGRYCTPTCRDRLKWQLKVAQGVLDALGARFASFTWADAYVILTVLPADEQEAMWFVRGRLANTKPGDALVSLVDNLGTTWHRTRGATRSRRRAGDAIRKHADYTTAAPDFASSMSPHAPPKAARDGLLALRITVGDLHAPDARRRLERAFRAQALRAHPDRGGSEEEFIRLKRGFEELKELLNAPRVQNKRAKTRLAGGWLYDATEDDWRSPA